MGNKSQQRARHEAYSHKTHAWCDLSSDGVYSHSECSAMGETRNRPINPVVIRAAV